MTKQVVRGRFGARELQKVKEEVILSVLVVVVKSRWRRCGGVRVAGG